VLVSDSYQLCDRLLIQQSLLGCNTDLGSLDIDKDNACQQGGGRTGFPNRGSGGGGPVKAPKKHLDFLIRK